jgi:hypothetical protein
MGLAGRQVRHGSIARGGLKRGKAVSCFLCLRRSSSWKCGRPDVPLFLLEAKMDEYISSGVQLGWLIDPEFQKVTIYRAGGDTEVLSNPATVAGEGPVTGFVLSLDGIL